MPQKLINCDCELCILKTLTLDKRMTTDKIVESILYHFIFRLGSLVKSKKELYTKAIKFIGLVNPSYLSKNENNELNERIDLLYKNIIDFGKGCRTSTKTSFTKLIHKEATYLKIIINTLDTNKHQEDQPVKIVEDFKTIVEDIITVKEDVKTLVETVENDLKTLVDDVKPLIVDIKNFVVIHPEEKKEAIDPSGVVQDPSGSYYSYCVIS